MEKKAEEVLKKVIDEKKNRGHQDSHLRPEKKSGKEHEAFDSKKHGGPIAK